jgi:hypothetical protein
MKRQTKLNSQEQQHEQQTSEIRNNLESSAIEFDSVEKMLRHDALHTPLPPTIAHRLEASLGPMPSPGRSWWRRWFGK